MSGIRNFSIKAILDTTPFSSKVHLLKWSDSFFFSRCSQCPLFAAGDGRGLVLDADRVNAAPALPLVHALHVERIIENVE